MRFIEWVRDQFMVFPVGKIAISGGMGLLALSLFLAMPAGERQAALGSVQTLFNTQQNELYAQRAQNRRMAEIFLDQYASDTIYMAHQSPAGVSIQGDDARDEIQPLSISDQQYRVETREERRLREQMAAFDQSLLPLECQQDYSFCTKQCEANPRIQGECNAFCVRQALKCDQDECQDRLTELKRSFFLWGIGLIFVGFALLFVFPPLGVLVFVAGIIGFGLSVAPIFDMINFMNCR
ncbi:MAG: hypothetical protein AAF723_08175 [Pseudomonadota bacterium]